VTEADTASGTELGTGLGTGSGTGSGTGTAPAPEPAPTVVTVQHRNSGERGWVFGLLPAFPLVLLILRVWYLSRQDAPTMLLVLQYANPLGLIASLLISLVWAAPAAVLLLRVMYLMLVVSDADRPRSWLAWAGARTPAWVSLPAFLLAALSWQLRFLPTLVMLAGLLLALEVRLRRGTGFAVAVTGFVLPAAAGLLVLGWSADAIWRAFGRTDDAVTALLLLVPPLVAPLLAGPLPARAARLILPVSAAAFALVLPVLVGGRYLAAPVLPRVAIEIGDSPRAVRTVLVGDLVAVNDRFTTVLDRHGDLHFVQNQEVQSQVLCTTGPQPPSSAVSVHGWHTQLSVLAWAARPLSRREDPRCRGLPRDI
jgi:hypothetical protein